MKELTEEQRKILLKYRNDYIDAIKELITIYEKRTSKYCPLCKLDKDITELHQLNTCSSCLWWILEGTRCEGWLKNIYLYIPSWAHIKVEEKKEFNDIRLRRIKMLKEWLEFIKNLK